MHRLIALAQQLTRPLKYRALSLPALCLGEFSSCNCSLGAPQGFCEVPRQGQPRLRVPLGGSQRPGRRRAGLQQPFCPAAATQTRLEASR